MCQELIKYNIFLDKIISLCKSFFFFFIIIFIINNNNFPIKEYEHPFYLKERKPIIEKDKKQKKVLIKGRKYVNKCLKGDNHKKYKRNENPKASVIIPVFNCMKTIKASLLSIQNQNLTKIEIILVNDFSQDNTSKIIKESQEKDERIKIINNFKNMGTLYSRSIGALMAKGKYIFCLDNDDMFFNDDILDFCYKIGIKENLDLIGTQTINVWNYFDKVSVMKDLYTFQYPDNYSVYQPELGRWMVTFNGKYLVHNNMIWDKCIKTSIYKKAVNLLGKKKYSNYLIWAEDTCINFIIFSIANSFKYFHKYSIFHFRSTHTASFIQPIEHRLYGETFFLEVIFKFSKNNTDKNLAVEQILYMEKQFQITKNNNNANIIKIKSIINKIMNCKHITKLNKRKLKKLFSD